MASTHRGQISLDSLSLAFCRTLNEFRNGVASLAGMRRYCACFNSQRDTQVCQATKRRSYAWTCLKLEIQINIHLQKACGSYLPALFHSSKSAHSAAAPLNDFQSLRRTKGVLSERNHSSSGELAPSRRTQKRAWGLIYFRARTLFHAWLDDVHANVMTAVSGRLYYNMLLSLAKSHSVNLLISTTSY